MKRQGARMKLFEAYQYFQKSHPYTKVDIQGHQVQYRIFGQGKQTILMLLGGSMFKYDAYFKLIEALEDKYQILTVDIPKDVKNIKTLIDIILEIIQKQDIDQVHVFGTSQGGGIAQVFAKEFKAQTRSLILYNTLTKTKHMNAHSIEVIDQVLEAIKELKELRKIMPLEHIKVALIDQIKQVLLDPNDTDLFEKLIMEYSEADETLQMKLIQDLLMNYTFEKADFEYLKEKSLIFYGHDDDPFGGTELIETLVDTLTHPHLEFIENDRMGLIIDPSEIVDKIKAFIN